MFRVLRDHDGRGVVCPSCRRMLRLPEVGEEPPMLVVPSREAPSEATRVHRRRHKRHKHHQEDGFDDDDRERPDDARMLKMLMISLAALAVGAAIILLIPPAGTFTGADPGEPLAGIAEPGQEPAAVTQPEPEEAEPAGPDLVTVDEVDDRFRPVIERFLTAPDIESMAAAARMPERALPRMRDHYGDDYAPPGFRRIVEGKVIIRKDGVSPVEVEDGSFDRRLVYLVEQEGGAPKVDWEASVGWSDTDWSQPGESRPREPLRLRARVKPVTYYNFSFDDELKWVSFLLESPDNEHRLYGYARRGSETDNLLRTGEGKRSQPFLVDVSFPPDNPSGNQVLIERASDGWVDLRE